MGKTYEVIIELAEDHGIKGLILKHKNGGYRITPRKAAGQWKTICKFHCSIPIAELERASTGTA